jgi:N6-adenosine-specific RNA methylase IME4
VRARKATKATPASAERDLRGSDLVGQQIESIATDSRPHGQGAFIALSSIVVPSDRLRRLRPEKVDELAESISVIGQRQPIEVRRAGDGYVLITGRHRFEAVTKLGHKDIHATILDGIDADQAKLIEIDENLMRVDLSPAERAIHLAERKRLYEKAHPQTKHGGDRRGGDQVLNNENLKSFTVDTANKTGKHRSSISREVARAKIVNLQDVVGTALDEGAQLDALLTLPEPMRANLINRAKTGEDVDARVEAMKHRRSSREAELAEKTTAAATELGKKIYGVIYADPPWRFETYGPAGQLMTSPDNHYPTMTLDTIKALKIPAAKDCVLFLWATIPMLPEAHAVMAAWGFTYKSAMVWVKDKVGIGYWVRGQAELLLIGRRGDVPAPGPGNQPPAVIETPRGRHSEKPGIFADEITPLYPNVPKLEMFAREPREGWDVWGNEVEHGPH